jgi:hypothetical protein
MILRNAVNLNHASAEISSIVLLSRKCRADFIKADTIAYSGLEIFEKSVFIAEKSSFELSLMTQNYWRKRTIAKKIS